MQITLKNPEGNWVLFAKRGGGF